MLPGCSSRSLGRGREVWHLVQLKWGLQDERGQQSCLSHYRPLNRSVKRVDRLGLVLEHLEGLVQSNDLQHIVHQGGNAQ